MKRTTVLLADDHAIVVEGLRRVLEPEFDVVGTVADGHALVESAETLRPDVIVAPATLEAVAVRKATSTIPIVCPALADAIHLGLEWGRVWRTREAEINDLRRRFGSLTRRERDVVTMVASGALNKLIADQLGVSENTVKAHRMRVMEMDNM